MATPTPTPAAAAEKAAKKAAEIGADTYRQIEKMVLLQTLDHLWREHLVTLEHLRQVIGLRAYGQRNPVQEYRMESYDMFNDMVRMIREDTVRRLYQARVERQPERQKAVDVSKTQEGFAGGGGDARANTNGQAKQGGAPTSKNQPGAVGRNQPCPCGSGKKYKHCCGKNA